MVFRLASSDQGYPTYYNGIELTYYIQIQVDGRSGNKININFMAEISTLYAKRADNLTADKIRSQIS